MIAAVVLPDVDSTLRRSGVPDGCVGKNASCSTFMSVRASSNMMSCVRMSVVCGKGELLPERVD